MGDSDWAKAVEWLRSRPEMAELVRDCYLDDPPAEAAQRFERGDEWAEVRRLLPSKRGRALDLGAGRGIASCALARDGWKVVALEPDPSPIAGAAAARRLARQQRLSIHVVRDHAESLPFGDEVFDLIYGRQVLHHARDVASLCREAGRVLKPGGRFLATREHVISKPDDLEAFLSHHPLHGRYDGEGAHLLDVYVSAIVRGGFARVRVIGSWESPINYYPMSRAQWKAACAAPLRRMLGGKASALLASEAWPVGRFLLKWLSVRRSRKDAAPGRLVSFVAEKPRA